MEINQILSDDGNCSVLCKIFSKKGRDWVKIEISSWGGTLDFEVDREYLGSIADQLKQADKLLHNEKKRGDE